MARLQLPGLDHDALVQRLGRDGAVPGEPDRTISAVIDRIEDYADGAPVDFADVAVDLSGAPAFHVRVYGLMRGLGWGQTTSYGALAQALGDTKLSRAVGQAMGANPVPLIIPCHRVLASNGKPGGFSAPGGTVSKLRMLEIEGVWVGAPAGQMAFGF